jgi:hypothetical protein
MHSPTVSPHKAALPFVNPQRPIVLSFFFFAWLEISLVLSTSLEVLSVVLSDSSCPKSEPQHQGPPLRQSPSPPRSPPSRIFQSSQMGAPRKWLKSLITLKKPHATNEVSQNISNQTLRFSSPVFVSGLYVFIVYLISVLVVQDKDGDNTKKKWKLWRSSSEGMNRGHMFASKASESRSCSRASFRGAKMVMLCLKKERGEKKFQNNLTNNKFFFFN